VTRRRELPGAVRTDAVKAAGAWRRRLAERRPLAGRQERVAGVDGSPPRWSRSHAPR